MIGIILIASLLALAKKKKNSKMKKSTDLEKKEFTKKMLPYCKDIGQKIGVPYMFLLAQITLETNYGKSSLFAKYFNVGGIKAVKGQKFVSLKTQEDASKANDGKTVTVMQNFAVYSNLNEGLTAYAKILTNRYFKQHQFKTSNPFTYVDLLQSGQPKYATDDNYQVKIKKQVEFINKSLLV